MKLKDLIARLIDLEIDYENLDVRVRDGSGVLRSAKAVDIVIEGHSSDYIEIAP